MLNLQRTLYCDSTACILIVSKNNYGKTVVIIIIIMIWIKIIIITIIIIATNIKLRLHCEFYQR